VSHPFRGLFVPALYASEDRTVRRSDALLTAKTAGRNITDVVLDYADAACLPPAPVIVEVGCGQGRTAVRLARHYPQGIVLAIDASPAMAAATRQRAKDLNVQPAIADFHHLPVADGSTDLAVAIMCLYHSPAPHRVITEMARTLRPTGTAVLVTKAADSYRELADLLERSGLDPRACDRPSLYETAHSGNLPDLAEAGGLTVRGLEHEQHTFTFTDLAHAAAYLTTCPQYLLPGRMRQPDALAEALRARLPDEPVVTTATITYLVGGRT
jgi:SAM-dependent methyltransferase